MTTWFLYLCINATAMGCGNAIYRQTESLQQCQELVRSARVEHNGVVASGETGRQTVIACIPERQEPKK